MKIRNKKPSKAFMIAVHNLTVPENRPVTIERDGLQIVADKTMRDTLKEARDVCFKRVRRDYELLGKPKIEGWCIIYDRGDYIHPGDVHFYAIKLYLKKL